MSSSDLGALPQTEQLDLAVPQTSHRNHVDGETIPLSVRNDRKKPFVSFVDFVVILPDR